MSKPNKTLALHRETIIHLTPQQLGAANGGTLLLTTATIAIEGSESVAAFTLAGLGAVRQAHGIAEAVGRGYDFLRKHPDPRPANKVPGVRIIK